MQSNSMARDADYPMAYMAENKWRSQQRDNRQHGSAKKACANVKKLGISPTKKSNQCHGADKRANSVAANSIKVMQWMYYLATQYSAVTTRRK